MKNGYSRNYALDYMRVLGLFLVILAHCGIPDTLFELRNFDVTMLIFVSAFVFAIGYHGNWRNYFTRRLRRILIPVWSFLVMYFVSTITSGRSFDLGQIISSFLMVDGIGYVWIFRIVLTLAMINPLIYKLTDKLNPYVTLIIAVMLMFGNHLLDNLISSGGTAEKIIRYVVVYTVGYGTISILGMKWRKLQKKEKIVYLLVFIAIFAGFGLYNKWPSLQAYKYPPKEYYICYGLIWSVVLYELLTAIRIRGNGFVNWVGSHTLYIYLAHIVMLELLHLGKWYLLYGCVLTGSIVLAYLFCLVKDLIYKK